MNRMLALLHAIAAAEEAVRRCEQARARRAGNYLQHGLDTLKVELSVEQDLPPDPAGTS